MKKNVDIKDPCSEDWVKMTPTQKGAFCDKCALEVYDFSDNSGDEIRDILKLNVGKNVCGRLAPEQLADLNVDFNAWQINSKRSFQSALIFSLIVAFGMTLFGCEEDEEEQQIDRVQEIGMFFLRNDEPVSIETKEINLLDEVLEDAEIQIRVPIEVIPAIKEIDQERLIMGRMIQELPDKPQVVEDVRVMVAGGIGYSSHYQDYLEEIPPVMNVDALENFQFEALVFPNPATVKMTLRIVMPEKEKVQIKLFNLAGQFINDINSKRLKKGETNLAVDIIDLPRGTYIISIISDNYSESVKFIKL